MFRTILFFILLLVISISHADDSDSDSDPYSNDVLLYACDVKDSWVWLDIPSFDAESKFGRQLELGRYTERISTSELIKYSPEDKNGNVFRTGSKTIIRQCGRFKISIQHGFLNPNPNGEFGSYDFPVVEVSVDKKNYIHCNIYRRVRSQRRQV